MARRIIVVEAGKDLTIQQFMKHGKAAVAPATC